MGGLNPGKKVDHFLVLTTGHPPSVILRFGQPNNIADTEKEAETEKSDTICPESRGSIEIQPRSL